MKRQRITLSVEIDLDPVSGTFHEAHDVEKRLQQMLDAMVPSYNPVVSLRSALSTPLLQDDPWVSEWIPENKYGEHQKAVQPSNVKVGDGLFTQVGSDRYAYTVQWASPSGAAVRVSRDNSRLVGGDAFSERQEYEFLPQKYNTEEEMYRSTDLLRWNSKLGCYVVPNTRLRGRFYSGRRAYRNPSF